MAGSYKHIIDHENKFIGTELIDNLGDAYEALEECYDMIEFLTGGDKQKIFEAHLAHLRKHYPHHRPGDPDYAPNCSTRSFESFWEGYEE